MSQTDPTITDPINPLEVFELPWETLDAIIEGKSPIDLTSMPIKTREEAYDVIFNYGYDTCRKQDREDLGRLFQEAIGFIENRFLTSHVDWQEIGEPSIPVTEIPIHLKALTHIEDLILVASGGKKPDRQWACAILKVLHTLAHIHNNPTLKYFQEASDSIVSNFHKLLLPQPDGSFCLSDRDGRQINLYGFETKHKKPRESILIKLLCKKENVAEDVWDLVGVRLITHHPIDALLAIDILRSRKVILFSNIIPSRSRNTLLDFEKLRTDYEKKLSDIRRGQAAPDSVYDLLQTLSVRPPQTNDFRDNPSSLPDYRSIHMTCRYFLRLHTDDTDLEELDGTDLHLQKYPTDVRLAFPYEIQILDKHNFLENQDGKSAHTLYKRKQLVAARRRVLGPLLQLYS